jgi:alkylation response protein AidB-like acyl-CoA dehydrogenase
MATTMERSGLDMVRAMAPTVLSEAAASERNRTLTQPIVDAMWSSGLMQFINPAEAGGSEPGFHEIIETWIDMACLDGSFGWIGIANLPSAMAAASYLPEAGFDEVFRRHGNRVTMGGQFFPNGRGIEVDGGWRVTGAWSFGSGTGHSEYVAAGFFPMNDGGLRLEADGMPVMMAGFFPREEVTFTDGWFVQGLKGTGSFDYELHDIFLPTHRAFGLFDKQPYRGSGPIYQMGLMAVTAAGHAAWALGVAKSMLDDVKELAGSKVRMGEMNTMGHRQSFQKGYAHHHAMWQAAHLLVLDAFERAEAAVRAGQTPTPEMRAEMRIAATYATDASREVAQWAHLASGTTAIREGSRIERAFRDLYTGTQHAFIGERVTMDAAQVVLGLIGDQPRL